MTIVGSRVWVASRARLVAPERVWDTSPMAKRRKTWIAFAVTGACLAALWSAGSSDGTSEAAGTKRFVNQLWIERMPKDERDMFGRIIAARTDDGRIGIASRGSTWRHHVELFLWALEEDRLTAVFPQDRVRSKLQIRTWECKGEAPAPFELCLELRAGERRARFYSKREWKIRPRHGHDDLRTIADEHPSLASLVGDWDASRDEAAIATPDPDTLRDADFALGVLAAD